MEGGDAGNSLGDDSEARPCTLTLTLYPGMKPETLRQNPNPRPPKSRTLNPEPCTLNSYIPYTLNHLTPDSHTPRPPADM